MLNAGSRETDSTVLVFHSSLPKYGDEFQLSGFLVHTDEISGQFLGFIIAFMTSLSSFCSCFGQPQWT